jgi:hypothetical protein
MYRVCNSFLSCVFHRLTQHLRHEILPVTHVLETNLLRLVEEKWKVASSMVKPIFQHEFNLSVHFQIMRGIFLMEAGDIMHHFYTSLFEQVTSVISECAYSAQAFFNSISKCVWETLFMPALCDISKPYAPYYLSEDSFLCVTVVSVTN